MLRAVSTNNSGGGGGGAPGGATGNVQYNNAGAFAGDPAFTTDGAGNITMRSFISDGGTVFSDGGGNVQIGNSLTVNGVVSFGAGNSGFQTDGSGFTAAGNITWDGGGSFNAKQISVGSGITLNNDGSATFSNNNTEIDSLGNMIVGGTLDLPNYFIVLTDNGTTIGGLYSEMTGSAIAGYDISPGNYYYAGGSIIVNGSGLVGINQTNPMYAVDVTGDVNVTGDFLINGTPIGGTITSSDGSLTVSGSDLVIDTSHSNVWTSTQFFAGVVNFSSVTNFNQNMNISPSGKLVTLSDGTNFVLSSFTNGNKWGTATNQKQAWWNATPIVQPANTTAIDTLLTNTGLRASGGTSNFATQVKAPASTTSAASLNVASGTAPTSPADGDVWYDSTQKNIISFVDGINSYRVSGLFSATASSGPSNTGTETSLIGSGIGTATLPANFFVAGKTIRIKGGGVATTPLSPGSLVIKVKYGSTVLATATITNLGTSATNEGFQYDTTITCRSTGSSGTVMTVGNFVYDITTITKGAVDLNNSGSTATINTTTANALDVTATWSTSTTSTITGTIATIESLQ